MAIYGYARASTLEQNVTIQEDALRRAGCEVIRSEKVSGSLPARDDRNWRCCSSFSDVVHFDGNARRSAGALDQRSSGHRS